LVHHAICTEAISATSLASILGIAVKNAIRILDALQAAGSRSRSRIDRNGACSD
jgi:hypothetical protein